MSNNWVKDIEQMHGKYGVHKWMETATQEQKMAFLKFRMAFIKEEFDETLFAVDNNDPEEIVDGLIDMCVVAIGTLDAFGVDAYTAWDNVHAANMAKEVGVKPSRPNPLKLPDLIKPTMETHGFDWEPPSHEGNHGEF